MKAKKERRSFATRKNEESTLGDVMIHCSVFTLIFCAVSAIMILIFSWIFYSTSDPTSKIPLASLCALYSSCFTCSFALSRINGDKNILCGIVFGAFVVILTLLFSLFTKEGYGMKNSVIFRALIPVVTVTASLLAKKKIRTPKHRMHK